MTVETIYATVCPNLRLKSSGLSLGPGEGTVAVTVDGTVAIRLVVEEQSLELSADRIPEIDSANGQTSDGFELTVETLWCESTSTSWGPESSNATELTFTPKVIRMAKPGESKEDWTRKEYWLMGPRVIGKVAWSWNSYDFTFIDNRNALFHTGRTASNQTAPASPIWPMLKPELVKLHNEIDDIILTILRYAGLIHSYWDYSTTLTFPGRTPA